MVMKVFIFICPKRLLSRYTFPQVFLIIHIIYHSIESAYDSSDQSLLLHTRGPKQKLPAAAPVTISNAIPAHPARGTPGIVSSS